MLDDHWDIRSACPEDAPAFLELVAGLAEYERLDPPDSEARRRLVRDGFGPERRFEPHVVEWRGELVGYAVTFETYSTFLALPTLYLEDLFVRPDCRGKGIGTELLAYLAQEAVRRGCGRMEWTVLDWNEKAQRVYARFGAQTLSEWRICRLTRDVLAQFDVSVDETDSDCWPPTG